MAKQKEYESKEYGVTLPHKPDQSFWGLTAMLKNEDEFSMAVEVLHQRVEALKKTSRLTPEEQAPVAEETTPTPHVATALEKVRNLVLAGAGFAAVNIALYAFFKEYFNLIPRPDFTGLTREEVRHFFALGDTAFMDTVAFIFLNLVAETKKETSIPQRVKNTLNKALTGLPKLGRRTTSAPATPKAE